MKIIGINSDEIKRKTAAAASSAWNWCSEIAVVFWKFLIRVFRNLGKLVANVTNIYLRKRVSRSAAQISFHIIFSIFPLLICIHWFVGLFHMNYDTVIVFISRFLPESAVSIIVDYLDYIAMYQSDALLYAGIVMLIAPSSAALRALKDIINDIHNRGRRGRNLLNFLVSFAVSILFLLVVYACIIMLLTGSRLLNFLVDTFDLGRVILNWNWLRFFVMFIFISFLLYVLYRFLPYNIRSRDKVFRGNVTSGVLFSSLALVVVSIIFSWFISLSTRYSLIYGSLASIIIFMLWLYTCCNIIIIGSIINFLVSLECRRRGRRSNIFEKKNSTGNDARKLL